MPNKEELELLLAKANLQEIPSAYFREEDMNDEITAIALPPLAKKLVKHLPLAFKHKDK